MSISLPRITTGWRSDPAVNRLGELLDMLQRTERVGVDQADPREKRQPGAACEE